MAKKRTSRVNGMNVEIKFKKYSLGKNQISNDIIFEWNQTGDLIHSYDIKNIVTNWYDNFELHKEQRKKINDVTNWLKKEHPELML